MSVIRQPLMQRFVLKVLLALLLAEALALALMLAATTRSVYNEYGALFRFLSQYRWEVLKTTLLVYGLFGLFAVAVVGALAVFYSHKVAGPLYRLRCAARDMSKGRLGMEVSFRKGDAVHSLADAFNAFSTASARRSRRILQACRKMRAACEALQGRGDTMATLEALKKLREAQEELEEVFSELKL